MAAPSQYRPGRVLALLLAAVVAISVWAFWPGVDHTPRLGLDLQGGTQVILDPRPIEQGAEISEDQLQQSVEIIRQRVNGVGVAEADISIQGAGNDAVIVVSAPGVTQERIVELVGRTALLDFRPVNSVLNPSPTDDQGEPLADAQSEDSKESKNSKESKDESDATGTDGSDGAAEDGTDEEVTGPGGVQIVQAKELNAKFQTDVMALDCTTAANQSGGTPDNPEEWLGTCGQDGLEKFILEPAFILGASIDEASAQLAQQGAGGWVVTLGFDGEGSTQLAEVSGQLAGQTPPTNRFAIVLDGVVVSAPTFEEQIIGGNAQISGNFSAQEAQDLANVLKFGALPITLEVQAVESVSATLGTGQLNAGILAGVLGLLLVSVYLLFYYRALGIVAGVSLGLAGWITYCTFVILGNTIGFTLTLAGIAGAIVAVGITADSFVVYFERLRDEIRDGKSLRRAADDGWARARRTLLAADFVSLLAAMVLYWLSVGNVRGFAFALGLTTIVDVVVAFFFTRPLVSMMTRSRWMQRGSAFTGVSPKRLGVESLAGRQRPKGSTRRRVRVPAGAGSAPGESAPEDGEDRAPHGGRNDDGAQV